MSNATEQKKVVGLRYEPAEGLPQLIVKGTGQMAEEILRKGNSGDGPVVVKDKALLDQLFRLPMDAQIGPELFQVVATLLAHVFAVEQKRREGK